MGVILPITDSEILISFFHSMLLCGGSPDYLQAFIKISGLEVLLFSEINEFMVKAFKN